MTRRHESSWSSSLTEVKIVMVGTQSVKFSDRSEDSDGGNPVKFSDRSEDSDGGNPVCQALLYK